MSEIRSTVVIKVLVTGFGPFLDITTNPSWEIVRTLPTNIHTKNGNSIELIVPVDPIPAAYHKILAQATSLIEQHDPDIIVHVGLATDRDYFAVERSAPKEGYQDIPDVDRKVFTRAENKKMFGKAPSSLTTSLDLESAVAEWQVICSNITMPVKREEKAKGKAKGKCLKKSVDVRFSNDVGTYVCGFIYYISMLEMQKRRGKRNVVFLHVPRLDGKREVDVGVEVTRALIGELADGLGRTL